MDGLGVTVQAATIGHSDRCKPGQAALDSGVLPPPRETLGRLYQAAIDGANPETATRDAVAQLAPGSDSVHIIALGKAAVAMANGAIAALGRAPTGGVIVAPASAPSSLPVVVGDHPIPGAGSLAAATAIGEAIARVGSAERVLALVSGGASALVAAPLPDIEDFGPIELARLYEALLASGADIEIVNGVRKRFTRWSAGRVATALPGRRIDCLLVSDVPGDDPASISSGPCVGDPMFTSDLIARLERSGRWLRLDQVVRRHLERIACGEHPDTPKPGDPAFMRVTARVIVSNRHAVEAAAARARELGIDEVIVVPTLLSGEASIVGVRMASELLARRKLARGAYRSRCVLWGGETTVTLGAAPGLGGRSQELALAAARSLADAGETASGIAILAAGTDGRDGPTDAAGAIVDGLTWTAVSAAGRDPAADLASHDAYRALDAASALLRTGYTGTNVMDVAFGLIV
jgi:glycerate 2-kinase